MRYSEIERSIRNAYAHHKSSAKQRGIEFTLSFDQWWELWAPHWHNRGRRADQMQMCRNRDEGGYTLGNVRIDTQRSNAAERGCGQRVKRASSFLRPKAMNPHMDGWMAGRYVFDEYSEEEDLTEM